jgi:hypothetical protein
MTYCRLNVHQRHGVAVLRIHDTRTRHDAHANLREIALSLRVPALSQKSVYGHQAM